MLLQVISIIVQLKNSPEKYILEFWCMVSINDLKCLFVFETHFKAGEFDT